LVPEQAVQVQENINIGQYIEDLVDLYEALRDMFGSRNSGYFKALLQAQASGQRQEYIETVRPVFIADDLNGSEPVHMREAEAKRIEASALNYRLSGTRAIPLTFAERLCIERFELGGQVLYGLWALGFGGEVMTASQIIEALKPIVPMSNRSIYSGINLLHDISIL